MSLRLSIQGGSVQGQISGGPLIDQIVETDTNIHFEEGVVDVSSPFGSILKGQIKPKFADPVENVLYEGYIEASYAQDNANTGDQFIAVDMSQDNGATWVPLTESFTIDNNPDPVLKAGGFAFQTETDALNSSDPFIFRLRQANAAAGAIVDITSFQLRFVLTGVSSTPL
jgi:hypothetical protein